jgi:hypothetical protein
MNGNKSITIDGEEVEWTKDGVEQILATVGIQCVYNSDVSSILPLISNHHRHH